MREAHPTERAVGMDYYVSDAAPVGGRLRDRPEDFRVRELEAFDVQPVDADVGDYPHVVCRVTLRGWDTNDFAKRLSDAIGMSRERVAWAGTKDKHAVTTQLFSLDGVDPDAVPDDIADADVEVLGRTGRAIQFGDLAGNAFEIRVSDPTHPERSRDVTADLRAFADRDDDRVAVPNYFGQQRFGSRRPVTHEVGRAVVRGDWQGAVMAYLGNPRDTEPEATQAARAAVQAAVDDADDRDAVDWTGLLDEMPRALGYERSMLHTLADGGTWRDALETVPANLQRLFVHAAQSDVFNRILSERLERGLPFTRPVEGDVVCFSDGDGPDGLPLPDTGRTQRVTDRRVDSVTRHCERDRAFVTAPLVGTDTDLADGEPGEIERQVLDELDLSPGDFDRPDDWHSTGDRRAIAVTTDLDLAVADDHLDVAFQLPKGSYATVVLREYLKVDPVEM
jgi:tRNA pseudouridine13 synthase